MKKINTLIAWIILVGLAVSPALAQSGGAGAPATTAIGSSFTYQGQLKNAAGEPVEAICDLRFTLWDAAEAGGQIGGESLAAGLPVAAGYFTAQVNASGEFGASAFAGEPRWLEISVRCPAGSGDYAVLTPRQPLTAAPYASYAAQAAGAPWGGLSGVPAGFADGIDNDTLYTAGGGLRLSGGEFALLLSYQLPQTCEGGQIPEWNNLTSRWNCAADNNTTYAAGNGLTLSGTQFSVVFGGSGSANTVARSDHNHWGAVWSGSGTGLELSGGTTGLEASGSDTGIQGFSTSGAGVRGESNGIGVSGSSLGNTLSSIGVWGYHSQPTGYAIRGYALEAIGVSGQSLGEEGIGGKFVNNGNGVGVFAEVTGTSGATYGVQAFSSSPDGYAVYGKNDAGGGNAYGVYGETNSQTGYGVYGLNTAAAAQAYGVYGESESLYGIGVEGRGNSIGVEGQSDVMGVVGWGHDDGSIGVYGYSWAEEDGMGVYAGAWSGIGLEAHTNDGIAILASGSGVISSTADTDIYLSPFTAMRRDGFTDLTFTPLENGGVRIKKVGAATGERLVVVPVSTAGVLFGAPVYVKSIEVCYKTSAASGYITGSGAYKGNNDTYSVYLSSSTDYSSTTRACYTVTASNRAQITNSSYIQLHLQFTNTSEPEITLYSVKLTLTEEAD